MARSCRRISKTQARNELEKLGWSKGKVDNEMDALDYGGWGVRLRGERWLEQNVKESGAPRRYQICLESTKPRRPSSGRGKKAAKSFFSSKPGIGIAGAVVGFILGKVF